MQIPISIHLKSHGIYAIIALSLFMMGLSLIVKEGMIAVAYIHMLFAMGVMPLIMTAVLYFVPVLTRSSASLGWIRWMPLLAFAGGLLLVGGLLLGYGYNLLAAIPALLACVALLTWMWNRGHTQMQRPHAGFYWYLASFTCLLLALVAILMAAVWPQQWSALRLFHLHLNVIGFIGITVVGTVRVLYPTVINHPDDKAAIFLVRSLPPAFLGTLAIAAGSAWWVPLAWVGLLLWLVPLTGLLRMLYPHCAGVIAQKHRAGISLMFAVLGWCVVMLAGAAHGAGVLMREHMLALFVLIFLLPLVTGALSYLLPVWMRPGRSGDYYGLLRTRLMYGSGWRVLGFWLGALCSIFWSLQFGILLGLLVLLTFIVQLWRAMRLPMTANNPS